MMDKKISRKETDKREKGKGRQCSEMKYKT
jgi:hypothetical protein